jgi:hypothetical protein
VIFAIFIQGNILRATVDLTLFNINRRPGPGKGKTKCKCYKSSSKADNRELRFEERLDGSVEILKVWDIWRYLIFEKCLRLEKLNGKMRELVNYL